MLQRCSKELITAIFTVILISKCNNFSLNEKESDLKHILLIQTTFPTLTHILI